MRMTWMIILSGIFISLVSMLGMAQPAQAALPPLSSEELKQEARYVVVGNVQTVTHKEVTTDLGSDRQYVAVVKVVSVEKGLLRSSNPLKAPPAKPGVPTPGAQIQVHYWQAGKRPGAWVGPGGQYSGLSPNTEVRLFLKVDEQGRLHLLEPNGSEVLSPK